MIIATWNVNSLNVRLPHVLDWLRKEKPDVLCIQETKLTDDKFPHQAFSELGYHSSAFGERTYNGVAIISLHEAKEVVKGFPADSQSDSKRLIQGKIDSVTILNVYVPNGQEVGSDKFKYKLNWISKLQNFLQEKHKPTEPLVICGDFNVALEDRDVYDPQALTGQILCSDQERQAIESLKDWGFIDTFRLHNPEAGLYSWWDYRMMAFRRKMGLRIDHIWATQPLAEKCARSWIDIGPRKLEKPSDHAPVVSVFPFN